MRAFRLAGAGAQPQVQEIDLPDPGPGEIRVRIAACGLNFADTLMIRGSYQDMPPLPATLGMELAGTVEALGPGVDGPAVGTRVAICAGHGGLAEAGNFPAALAVPLPEGMSFETAAGFQIAYGTSHLALTRAARLAPGETLVVTGAAGGVGLTAVEIGAQLGARVIAVARGAAKLALAREAGAAETIEAEGTDLRAAVKALGGADVVYETVGGDSFESLLRALRPEGRMLAIGFAGGQVPAVKPNHLLVKNISVIGFYWGGYRAFAPEVLRASMAELFAWHGAGRLRPHVGAVLPLERAAEGLEMLRSRQATGKIVIATA
ncbi:NADPH:quinone oxidoreductase family protein [Frigidibacter sp. MR17.24]|uniref:NADPH:quinone oxidoreductase family protein n=1 Tax=Frigidibacter sp. MR17.24 TaxID=3127345 RepID=UPI003012E5FC